VKNIFCDDNINNSHSEKWTTVIQAEGVMPNIMVIGTFTYWHTQFLLTFKTSNQCHSKVYYLVWESTEPQSVKNNERKRERRGTMTLKKQCSQ
jgi:hypothetical protein